MHLLTCIQPCYDKVFNDGFGYANVADGHDAYKETTVADRMESLAVSKDSHFSSCEPASVPVSAPSHTSATKNLVGRKSKTTAATIKKKKKKKNSLIKCAICNKTVVRYETRH